MSQVILGRVISGAGGAGMTALVSIIISGESIPPTSPDGEARRDPHLNLAPDLLPIREVASWRSYINVVATTGRSLGGPVGGWLADVVGWRWSFFGQVPFMLLATALVMFFLPNREPSHGEVSAWRRLRRVDFAGSALLALFLLACLIPMEIGGIKVPWTHPVIPGLFAASGVLFVAFLRTEQRATEPVVPLAIFRVRDVNLSMLIQMLQTSAQLGVCFRRAESGSFLYSHQDPVSDMTHPAHVLGPALLQSLSGRVQHDCRRPSLPSCGRQCRRWRHHGPLHQEVSPTRHTFLGNETDMCH